MCALPDLCQAAAKSCLPSGSTEFAQKGKRVGFVAHPPHGMLQRSVTPRLDLSLQSCKFFHGLQTTALALQACIARVS